MQHASNDRETPDACAALLLDTAPLVMRRIRAQMRGHRAADLSVPQFRALGFIRRHARASLGEVAEHLGLTPPATSRLVDGLVARGYLQRQPSAADRRTVELTASAKGVSMLDATRERALADLQERLAPLSVSDRQILISALETLQALFASERAATGIAAAVGAGNSQIQPTSEDISHDHS